MAEHPIKGTWEVGDLVYRHGAPAQCAKIINIEGYTWTPQPGVNVRRQRLKLKNLKGEQWTEDSMGFRNFRALVEDHERKAMKHRLTAQNLEVL